MKTEFDVRPYIKGDEKAIVQLLTSSFPSWAREKNPQDHYTWKYLEAPNGSRIIVAVGDDKIIGASHNLNLKIKIGNSSKKGVLSGDVATHPDYRGIGVYSKILDYNIKIRRMNFQFGYSASINPIILKKRKTLPDRSMFPHPINFMYRIKDIDLHLKMRANRSPTIIGLGYKILKMQNRISKTLNSNTRTSQNFIIEQISRFDDRIDMFWDRIKGEYNYIMEKNREYLNWRYCDPRAGDYITMQATENGEVLGFVVLNLINYNDYEDGLISDLLALPGRLDVATSLMREACEYFDDNGVNAVSYSAVRDNPYLKIAGLSGFIHAMHMRHVIGCQTYDKEAFENLRTSPSKRVYFSYGDNF